MNQPYSDAMDLLASLAGQLGVVLSHKTLAQLEEFCVRLSEYNSHTNLVSRSEPDFLVREHILDSLTLVGFIESFRARLRAGAVQPHQLALVDIGSGAGFPGLILAIVVPDLQVTLIDSIGKKTRFLEQIASLLKLDGVSVHTGRAEDLARVDGFRGAFDLATGRAVGSLDLIAELTVPLLRVHGQLLVQKSTAQLDQDMKTATRALPKLGARVIETTALDSRILGKDRAVIVVEKVEETKELYPRTWAKIKAKPLGV